MFENRIRPFLDTAEAGEQSSEPTPRKLTRRPAVSLVRFSIAGRTDALAAARVLDPEHAEEALGRVLGVAWDLMCGETPSEAPPIRDDMAVLYKGRVMAVVRWVGGRPDVTRY